ncbi:uncharacterized protein LOC116270107 [Papio anubis]|uniref:uncharacterized protein LOC116270107 n=1 Tax=Papio anubis TaxID=9555 RepID=UPI0012AE9B1F|nr:uncharacterized protein LOC116270107 [Papio anubis]
MAGALKGICNLPERRAGVRQRGRRRERTEGRPGGWPRPADPARVPRRGVALRARAGAARTAVPAPPPQSAPRSARTCRRRRRAETRAPRPRPRPSVPPGPCHRLRSLRPPREPPEPPKLPGQDAGAASGPAFETTSAAAARGRDARLGQLRPGPGLASAPAAEPAARVLLQPALRLAAFPGRPVLEPWGPPSPCLPRCPGPRPADLGYRGSPPPRPLASLSSQRPWVRPWARPPAQGSLPHPPAPACLPLPHPFLLLPGLDQRSHCGHWGGPCAPNSRRLPLVGVHGLAGGSLRPGGTRMLPRHLPPSPTQRPHPPEHPV